MTHISHHGGVHASYQSYQSSWWDSCLISVIVVGVMPHISHISHRGGGHASYQSSWWGSCLVSVIMVVVMTHISHHGGGRL